MIEILAVDDHQIVLEGLDRVFSEIDDITIKDTANSGKDALQKLKQDKFDVVLLDITLPEEDGMDVLKQIKKKKSKLPVIIFSIHPPKEYAIKALKNGASAYIPKTSDPEVIIEGVRQVVNDGKKYICPSVGETLANYFDNGREVPLHEKLTKREFQVMRLLASGKKIEEVAEEFSIKIRTVRAYKVKIMKKLEVNNDAQLTLYAMKNNLI